MRSKSGGGIFVNVEVRSERETMEWMWNGKKKMYFHEREETLAKRNINSIRLIRNEEGL